MLVLNRIELPLARFTLTFHAELRAPVTAIFGASGAGKTSLLDLIAGIRTATSAFIAMDDRVLTDTSSGICVPTHRRRIGYVPQDLSLFPHLNVRQNLLYGARRGEIPSSMPLEHIVAVLEIATLLERDISSLSGGEKQRVALARSLLAEPHLLLLDEPMASLDRPLKERLYPYLSRIRDEFHVPMLYVAHDSDEVTALCDEVCVLEEGKLIERGPVAELILSSGSRNSR